MDSIVLLGLLILAALLLPLVFGIAAMLRSRRALQRLELVEPRLERIEAQLAALERRAAGGSDRAAAPAAELARPPDVMVAPPAPIAEPPPAEEPVLETSPVVRAGPGAPEAPAFDPVPAIPPPPVEPRMAPAAAAAPGAPLRTLEERVALVWFARIGALAFLLGAAYFFKYAVDNEWIGPVGRVALGALAGAAVLATAERMSGRARPQWVQAMLGTGVALLFVATYAASALYHLVPAAPAFAAVAVVALLGGALAMRHRGELVLVLSLVGGLLAPVLLSTGQDRPLALFGYLLLITGLALLVCARTGFAIAPWIALAGTSLLFTGWYGRFFDVRPPEAAPASGLPPRGPAGAYYPLGARAVPLAFAAAFTAQWAALALAALRRGAASAGAGEAREAQEGRGALGAIALLVTTLLLSHGAFAALLFDRAAALGTALAVLGVASTWLLGRAGRSELLALPLAASFLALLVASGGARAARLPVLLAMGLWCALYAASFLRQAQRKAAEATPLALLLAGLAAAAFAILAGVLLLGDVRFGYGLLLAGLSALYLIFAGPHRSAPAAAGAVALSFFGLLAAARHAPQGVDHGLLAAGAIWAAVYLAAAAYSLWVERDEPTPLRLAVASAPALGLLALALLLTAPGENLLRALLAAAGGAADLALGAAPLGRGRDRRPRAVLLGQALALFAVSAALLFSGATVTVVWAAMAATVAVLAARERDRSWLAFAGLLFLAALARLALRDVLEPERATSLFFATAGRQGSLVPAFLLNARSLAFAGTAAALLCAARFAARAAGAGDAEGAQGTEARSGAEAPPARDFGRAAALFLAVGHALVAALAVMEARAGALRLPAPPAVGDQLGFRQFEYGYLGLVHAQSGRLAMLTTLVLGLYAALLVAGGFAARERVHRWLGLALFAATVGKLALWDVWNLSRPYQIAVLMAVGMLLLAAAFLYARYGSRLAGLLRGGPAILLLGGGALLGAGPAAAAEGPAGRALDPGRFEQVATLEVAGPGLYRFEVGPELYRASAAPGTLADLRIAGPGAGPEARELPWMLRPVAAGEPERIRTATLLDPVVLPDGSARAVLDLGEAGLRHAALRLEIDGDEFLRRVKVESSDDGRRFGLLGEGGRVWSVAGAARSTEVRHPLSGARWLRVTLLPGEGRPVRLTGAAAVLGASPPPAPVRSVRAVIAAQVRGPRERSTIVDLDLGGAGPPFEAAELETARPLFERRVRASQSAGRDWFTPAGGGLVWRAPDGPPEQREQLRVPLSPSVRERWLRLEIEDGDASPLEVTGVSVRWRPREIVFRAEGAGPHRILLGAAGLAAPDYDLAAVLARSPGAAPAEARPGPPRPNPARRDPAPAALPFTERYRTGLTAGLALLLGALALWTVRLLRRAG